MKHKEVIGQVLMVVSIVFTYFFTYLLFESDSMLFKIMGVIGASLIIGGIYGDYFALKFKEDK